MSLFTDTINITHSSNKCKCPFRQTWPLFESANSNNRLENFALDVHAAPSLF